MNVVGMGASDLSSLQGVRQSMYIVMEAMDGGTLKDAVIRQMTSRWATVKINGSWVGDG